ncbi:MAG: hypothetical protein LBI44_07670 [Oscillospiraceae bacterium]|nr:hypothetical protein [Oscillospiraceae bacterium]
MRLRSASEADGFEHGAAIIDGKLYEFTSGFGNKVKIPESVADTVNNDNVKSVHLLHSHTNDTPHSMTDLEKLLVDKVDRISVIAHNGDTFSVYVGHGWIPTREEYRQAAKEISNEVDRDAHNIPEFTEWSVDERNYAGIREQAYRIVRHFKWTMEGGSLK